MKIRKLYEQCWLCSGTLKTTAPAMVDGKAFTGRLAPGAPCPACTDSLCKTPGYFDTGLTMPQIEDAMHQRDKMIVALAQIADGATLSPVAVAAAMIKTLKPGAVYAALDRIKARERKAT